MLLHFLFAKNTNAIMTRQRNEEKARFTMKKFLIVTGIVYSAVYIGTTVWMFKNPEAYGEFTGKVMSGIFKAMAE